MADKVKEVLARVLTRALDGVEETFPFRSPIPVAGTSVITATDESVTISGVEVFPLRLWAVELVVPIDAVTDETKIRGAYFRVLARWLADVGALWLGAARPRMMYASPVRRGLVTFTRSDSPTSALSATVTYYCRMGVRECP